jgi:hypothetical protein
MSIDKNLHFSQLFRDHSPKGYAHIYKGDPLVHPFYFLEEYLEKKYPDENLDKFEEGINFYNNLKGKQEHAFRRFEYEYCLVPQNKIIYLNEVVNILLDIRNQISRSSQTNFYNDQYLSLLRIVLQDILKQIFVSFHLDLNSSNRTVLSKWFYLKESITSFYFTNYIDEKRLKDLYQEYLVRPRFISYSDSFETFKCLFEGRRMENKINWIDQKSSLFLLIRLLRKHKIIRNTKNKHWLITSEFFLLKGETLIPADFLNQKETQNPDKRKNLIAFVNHLVD